MKNIIFDIGNILLSFQPELYLEKHFSPPQMGDLMMIIFASDEWVELDMGTMMIQDAIDSLTLKHPHYHDEIISVLENWTQMLIPITENVEIAYELKRKVIIYISYLTFIKKQFKQCINNMISLISLRVVLFQLKKKLLNQMKKSIRFS